MSLFYILHLLDFTYFGVFIAQFIMPKVYYCLKCALQHPHPLGKNYQLEGESLGGDVEVPAPPSPSSAGITTVPDQILSQLQELGDKMDLMDRGVQKTEAVLGQGSLQASSAFNTPQNASNNSIGHGIATESHATESVVPSMGFLRSNESLQSQVDKHLAELEILKDAATKCRKKSQRDGPV